jgi:hypothetical protein
LHPERGHHMVMFFSVLFLFKTLRRIKLNHRNVSPLRTFDKTSELFPIKLISFQWNLFGRPAASKWNYSPTFPRLYLPPPSGNNAMVVLCVLLIYITYAPFSTGPWPMGRDISYVYKQHTEDNHRIIPWWWRQKGPLWRWT